MGLVVTCTACKTKLRAPEDWAGRAVKCPKCRAHVLLPDSKAPTPRAADTPATPADDPQATKPYAPGRRGRFALLRLHAEGGIGQVWLARDANLGRDVALKELRDEHGAVADRARFLAEAQITGQLEHPGIVPVYELVRSDAGRQPFYTMRFVRGRTLIEAVRDYHRDRGKGKSAPLAFRALIDAFVAACNAVAYAHARGVVHRDLKGQNVVLGDFGEVMVLDWGLAKLLGATEDLSGPGRLTIDADGEHEATLHGQVLGTPAYMSPEQAEGRLDAIDERTNVYGLGAVLYEILTGAAPFRGASTQEVLRKVVAEEPVRPGAVAAVPRPLEAICLKAMAKRRKLRYASARGLATDVQRWLADEPVTAYREPLPRRVQRWGRRHPALVTAGLMLVLAAAVGGLGLQYELGERAAVAARAEGALVARLDGERAAAAARAEGALLARLDGERAAAAARTEGTVLAQLDEAAQLLHGADLDRARGAVERAQDRLAGGPPALQQRVRQARGDLDMVLRLEGVLLLETFTAGKHENPAANAAYLTAFQSYDLDLMGLDPAEAARRIKASAIREPLLTALDDWIFVKPRRRRGRERLLAVARLADSDDWRQKLRDPATHQDRATLERLAHAPEAAVQPPSLLVHLGKYLAQAGAWEASVEVLRKAQGRYPNDFWVNYALAMSLVEQKPSRPDEAVGFARVARALRPQSRLAQFLLGRELAALGQMTEAQVYLRRADELKGLQEPPCYLMLSAQAVQEVERGDFARAASFLKAALDLVPERDQGRQQLVVLLGAVERMVGLEKKLPAVLRGEVEPADAAEKALFAQLCQQGNRRFYAASARLYTEAFVANPKLLDDIRSQYRYNAACAAALAGAGQGEDAAKSDAGARAAWRKRALDWLRADLAFWDKVAGAGPAQATTVRLYLTRWQNDSKLASVRDVGAVATLPADEQDAFRKLWDDVRKLLAKVGGATEPDRDQ